MTTQLAIGYLAAGRGKAFGPVAAAAAPEPPSPPTSTRSPPSRHPPRGDRLAGRSAAGRLLPDVRLPVGAGDPAAGDRRAPFFSWARRAAVAAPAPAEPRRVAVRCRRCDADRTRRGGCERRRRTGARDGQRAHAGRRGARDARRAERTRQLRRRALRCPRSRARAGHRARTERHWPNGASGAAVALLELLPAAARAGVVAAHLRLLAADRGRRRTHDRPVVAQPRDRDRRAKPRRPSPRCATRCGLYAARSCAGSASASTSIGNRSSASSSGSAAANQSVSESSTPSRKPRHQSV